MVKLRIWLAGLLMLGVLVASASSQIYAYGSWTLPWGVERIHANSLWDNNNDTIVDSGANAGQNVTIAVIDFGIDYLILENGTIYYHPDLNGNVLGGMGFRYYGGTVQLIADYNDDWGHGTHVAGTIAAVGIDGGVVGVAPRTKIYALKLFTGDQNEVAAAINYSVDWLHANIISMSLGFFQDSLVLRTACDYAYYARGALLIAAAGNENASINYPAAYDSVVAVGAVDKNDQRWVNASYPGEGSNFGPKLELVAPGVDINSTWLNGDYHKETGTSMAVPHVTATAALIWSSKGSWDNQQVRVALRQYALDLGTPGRDDYYGYGLVNAWEPNQRPLGDINVDYRVNLIDVFTVALAYGSVPGDPKWDQRADINIDNKVNLIDYEIVRLNWGKVDP
jgi:subtilisin family serine protease